MKKILYSDFQNAEDIISELMKKMQPKTQSKVLTLFLAWKEIVGEKFAKCSRPIGLSKEKTLIVACQNPMISQELYLNKTRIMKSLVYYAESMQLKVEDVCFSHKIWAKYNTDKEE